MIPETFSGNLLPWLAQVLVVGSVGALLPVIFGIRNPRPQLAYCHGVLVACFLLPLIQPWQQSLVFTAGGSRKPPDITAVVESDVPISTAARWESLVLWTLVAGAAAKLCWLGIGLLRTRRYRIAARPLHSLPASIRSARTLTGADAVFCVSPGIGGPATLGYWNPVVLLPESFLALIQEAQCGIACHELLHVKRRDWAIAVLEAVVAALFWFNPGVWWLLAQAKLAREQLVDAEVVRLTADRERYVNALLVMAGAAPDVDLMPAPGFLRKRHLTRRMKSLLTEVSMSRVRLVSSYVCMTAILVVAGLLAFLSFPLMGYAQVQLTDRTTRAAVAFETARQAAQLRVVARVSRAEAAQPVEAAQPARETVEPAQQAPQRVRIGGDVAQANLTYKVDPEYPPLARAAQVQDTVVLDAGIGVDGKVLELRVVSGHPLLNQAAVDAVAQWRYKPFTLNGQPIEVVTAITVKFVLNP